MKKVTKAVCHKFHLTDVISVKMMFLTSGLISLAIIAGAIYYIYTLNKKLKKFEGQMQA